MSARFTDLINEMPLPTDWDAKVFQLPGRYGVKNFLAALKYAREKGQYVAKGSSRAVFKIDYEGRPTILKIAMNKAGLAQNETEANVLFDGVMGRSPVIIPGIDKDEHHDPPLWIHQEFAEKATYHDFDRILGGRNENGFWEMIAYLKSLNGWGFEKKTWEAMPSTIDTNHEMLSDLYELWGNLGFEKEFMADLSNIGNWGMYQNRPVIVDLGLNSTVAAMHYKRGPRPATPRGWLPPKRPRKRYGD